ncbi:MAG: manganese efflux pump [Clostridia bacterium]|nr:manganese efflux pump [Clostridia bacterium]
MLIKYSLLALSTSIDSIGIGIAYGLRNIKISRRATVILFAIALIVSTLAIAIGNIIHQILPGNITSWLGGGFLVLMGIILLLQSMKEPNSYDVDNSKQIDSKEAISLGIALSLDSFSIGIGTGVVGENIIWIFPILVAIFQIVFLKLGGLIGNKLTKISHLPSSIWNILAAILLIIIGIVSFFS